MKILVVEDDHLVAQTLSAILTMYRYAVEVVYDGLSAVEMLEAFEFDVIILDIFLPKLNGLEVCQQARAKGIQVPILMLTARDSSQDKAAGLDAGADDYVVKPFDPEELIARVRALLRRGRMTQDPSLTFGGLELNPESCEVHFEQQLVPLTPKEYALFELFLRNPKRVYSCGMILEHLWTHEETPGEEAVRTHIKGLRQKLKAAGAGGDLITTVYGIGYRLKPNNDSEVPSPSKSNSSPNVNFVKANASLEDYPDLQEQITEIWHQHQASILEKLNLIDAAIHEASHDNLSEQSRETAIRNAHSLAGSLGTFGVQSGSKLARSIEMVLMAESSFSDSDISQLEVWSSALRQAIADQSQEAIPEQKTNNETGEAHLLLLDPDRRWVDEITSEAQQLGYIVHSSGSLKNAITLTENLSPAAIVMDPAVGSDLADTRTFLADLHKLPLKIPVIIYSEQSTPELRLPLETLPCDYYLQKPLKATTLLHRIQKTIDRNQGIEASILAVDDDSSILSLLTVLLKPWGMKVHSLTTPETFWEALETLQPDLIILDVEMPVHNGIEICQSLRNNGVWSEIPVLFLTVHGNESIINEIFRVGADDYIQKPFVGPELVTRILNRIERNRLLRRLTAESKPLDQRTMASPDLSQTSKSEDSSPPVLSGQLSDLFPSAMMKILNIADDAILCIDHQQQVMFFNNGARRLFGYSLDEILGQPLNTLIPKRYNQAHHHHVQEFGGSARSAKPMGDRQEIFGIRKNGEEFPAEASIAKTGQGKDTLYTVILRDISERKRDEQRKDEFISVVSHELRTPLTAIHGALQVLTRGLKQNETDETDKLLSIAVNSTERLVRLVNNLLDVERINAGKLQMSWMVYDLAKLAQEAVDEMQPLANKAGVTLELTIRSIYAEIDRDRILQALTNLLSNAIRYSNSGQTVTLTLKRVDDQAQLEVIDHGRGIPDNKLEHIFERFHQVNSTDSRDRQGTGLGLAICRSIVQQHKGRIWVESHYGQGSHFYVSLPLAQSN